MKKSITLIVIVPLAVFVVFLLGASTDAGAQKKYDLRWGTAPVGGAFQVLASAIQEDIRKADPNISGTMVPSSMAANVMGVHEGKFALAVSLADTTATGWDGEEYFKPTGKIQDVRNLVTFYPQATHIVVRANSNITKIEDLKGKRVSPAAKGLSNDLEAQRLLKLYGMSYNDVKVQFASFEDTAGLFIDGHLDSLLFLTLPFPSAPVLNVSHQVPVKLLSIPDDKVAQLAKYRGVEPYTLPGGLYKGVDYPVKGIAVRAHLIARQDMPEDLAYTIVKIIAENFSRYSNVLKSMSYAKVEEMAKDVGIPFHPAATRYYKERGWVK